MQHPLNTPAKNGEKKSSTSPAKNGKKTTTAGGSTAKQQHAIKNNITVAASEPSESQKVVEKLRMVTKSSAVVPGQGRTHTCIDTVITHTVTRTNSPPTTGGGGSPHKGRNGNPPPKNPKTHYRPRPQLKADKKPVMSTPKAPTPTTAGGALTTAKHPSPPPRGHPEAGKHVGPHKPAKPANKKGTNQQQKSPPSINEPEKQQVGPHNKPATNKKGTNHQQKQHASTKTQRPGNTTTTTTIREQMSYKHAFDHSDTTPPAGHHHLLPLAAQNHDAPQGLLALQTLPSSSLSKPPHNNQKNMLTGHPNFSSKPNLARLAHLHAHTHHALLPAPPHKGSVSIQLQKLSIANLSSVNPPRPRHAVAYKTASLHRVSL